MTKVAKVELIHGCTQVGCNLAFVIEGKVLEGVVRYASMSEGDTLISVEVNGTFYELCVHNDQATAVEPSYLDAA